MKMMMELARLINSADPKAAMSQLREILQDTETQHSLDQFRLGFKREEEIIIEMISKVRESTGKQLTINEFNMAWNAMNPAFSEFASVLSEVVSEHHDDHKMVFVSYTNPKDMRHLTAELDSNSVPYTREEASGEINSICGIPLYLTYLAKKSKAELILQIIHQQKTSRSCINRGESFLNKNLHLHQKLRILNISIVFEVLTIQYSDCWLIKVLQRLKTRLGHLVSKRYYGTSKTNSLLAK
jgi:hypothetical protein